MLGLKTEIIIATDQAALLFNERIKKGHSEK